MNAVLKMSNQMILPGMTDCTSLPESQYGTTHSIRPDGDEVRYGQVPALANLSARQAKDLRLLTSGTYGQHSTTSSASAALQSSLVNRLRARTDLHGSTLYTLTWKERVTPSGRSISALRASARRTSDSGFIGAAPWPTPTTRDWKDVALCENVPLNALLGRVAWLSGWPTPTVQDSSRGAKDARPHDTGSPMNQIVALAGWNTPCSSDGNGGKRPHPETTMTGKHPSGRKVNMGLASQAHIGFLNTEPARLTDSGVLLTGSCAGMASGGQLNPAMSRWLMGLPAAWDECAPVTLKKSKGK